MELKEFTKLALVEIVEAAKEASEEFNGSAFISSKRADGCYWKYDPQSVEFDVAVTSTETDSNNGGAKLKVASMLSLGGEVSNQSVSQTVSRIKFTIPLVLKVSNQALHQDL